MSESRSDTKQARFEKFAEWTYPERELTERIIGCAVAVHRSLGPGYLEAIYERALLVELERNELRCRQQVPVKVQYSGVTVGEHRADLIAEDRVLVELKAVESLLPVHKAQVLSTLKAFGLPIGLLLNFNAARMIDGVQRVVRKHKQ